MLSARFHLRGFLTFIAFLGIVMALGMQILRLIRLACEYSRRADYYGALEKIDNRRIQLWKDSQRTHSSSAYYLERYGEMSRQQEADATFLRDHDRKLKEKYLRAASRPWEFVPPDPPRPSEWRNGGVEGEGE
jgi:hypothetical protein